MIGEAESIAKPGNAAQAVDAAAEVACLLIKWSSADDLARQGLVRLHRTRAAEMGTLTDRVQRHSAEARLAVARAERAAAEPIFSAAGHEPPQVAAQPDESGTRQVRRSEFRWAVSFVAAAAVLGAAVLIPGWLSGIGRGDVPREATLGNRPTATPLITASPTAGQAGVAAIEDDVLLFDFNDERMDLGIGAAWRSVGGADAVALAGFPTAVNRSARLENVDGSGAEACQSVPTSRGRLTRLVADVLVSRESATAAVIARWAGGGEVLVSLGTAESSMVIGGATLVAHERGLEIGQWYRVSIAFDESQTQWRVGRGAASRPMIERKLDFSTHQALDEVCLAISNDSTGQVHFDNVTIAMSQEG